MGRGRWTQAPLKGEAAAVGLMLVLLGWLIAAPPLGATCSCSISANLSAPDLVLSGTSSGDCVWRPRIAFGVNGFGFPNSTKECYSASSCSSTYNGSVSCWRTGTYTVNAGCWCGKSFSNADGTFYCAEDPQPGTAETTILVNTTPTVGVSVSGLNAEGTGTATIPFSFPNTIFGDPHRKLTLSVDGVWLADAYGSQVSGTWNRTLVTACWTPGEPSGESRGGGVRPVRRCGLPGGGGHSGSSRSQTLGLPVGVAAGSGRPPGGGGRLFLPTDPFRHPAPAGVAGPSFRNHTGLDTPL
jgi:hypothetical protein